MAVRSTFAGLNTMYRGISSSRLSLDTVGHNITNANTTGYSRQSVNLVATNADEIYTTYGQQLIGTGDDSKSITRARNVYADKQYWKEQGTNSYYASKQTNYDKVEAIFNDSDNTGIESSLEAFYKSWTDLSANASTTSNRTTVISKGQAMADRLSTATTQLQQQIKANYDDLDANVIKVNEMTDQIVSLNKNIASIEATGANANDLRDQRDNLVDTLSGYMSVNVYENADNGMYTIVSNGASIVAGVSKLNLELANPTANDTYGVTDYTLQIKETGTAFDAGNGTLKAESNSIDEDKGYIDKMTNMAAFLMTTFNDQHRAGYGITGSSVDTNKTNINFYGDNDTKYTWVEDAVNGNHVAAATTTGGTTTTSSLKGVQIISALKVNSKLTGTDGATYVAAAGGTSTTFTADATGKADTYTTYSVPEGDYTTGKVYAAGDKITVGGVEVKLTSAITLAKGDKVTLMISGTDAKKTATVSISTANGTADGSNATLMSTLFNTEQSSTTDPVTARSIDTVSLNNYYNAAMTKMGVDSSAIDDKASSQTLIMTQVDTWRTSTSGVNWDEELTNMIKFQQGYNACSRCLTTMDEMLDKLINSTGTVGR